MRDKKILYLDLDGVMVNLEKACHEIDPTIDISYGGENLEEKQRRFIQFAYDNPTLFEHAPLMEGAKEAFEELKDLFDVYFLSTPMWDVVSSYTAKAKWVKKHFPVDGEKRLILSHHKHLCSGAILVDDTYNNGADKFKGVHILFGDAGNVPDWNIAMQLLRNLA